MTDKERKTSPKVLKEVCLRAGGRWYRGSCFGGKCEMKGHIDTHDGRGLCFAHLKHRKMGGTTSPKVHSARNVKRSCYPCHEKYDNHGTLPRSQPVDKQDSIDILLGHYGNKFRPVTIESQVGKRK